MCLFILAIVLLLPTILSYAIFYKIIEIIISVKNFLRFFYGQIKIFWNIYNKELHCYAMEFLIIY